MPAQDQVPAYRTVEPKHASRLCCGRMRGKGKNGTSAIALYCAPTEDLTTGEWNHFGALEVWLHEGAQKDSRIQHCLYCARDFLRDADMKPNESTPVNPPQPAAASAPAPTPEPEPTPPATGSEDLSEHHVQEELEPPSAEEHEDVEGGAGEPAPPGDTESEASEPKAPEPETAEAEGNLPVKEGNEFGAPAES